MPVDVKGAAHVVLGGKPFTIRYTLNDLADADQHYGKSILRAFQEEPSDFNILRLLFYFGARPSKHFRTPREAFEFVTFADLEQIGEAIGAALIAAFPTPEEKEEPEDEPEGEL